jgi:hypothetical protein
LFEFLSADDDESLLEPFAFLSFSLEKPASNLDQIFAGYLISRGLRSRLTVSTEGDGSFYVPELGYLTTDQKDSTLELVVPANKEPIYLQRHGGSIHYGLEQIAKLPETSIELVQRPIGLLANCFVSLEGHLIPVDIRNAVADYAAHLANAVTIIARVWPNLYQAMLQTVRRLVLFRAEGMNSFATTAAHGTAFINVDLGDNEVFFVEDLAHQCGHIIFSAASFDAAGDFAVSPATPIALFNRQPDDQRSVYVVLHAVFTEALMALCLDACLTELVFDTRRQHELRGRLAFILRRFAGDLHNISRSGILSSQGEDLVHSLYLVWAEITMRRKEMTECCDFTQQEYNFCYRTFAEKNPKTLAADTF